jgi:hypothetical protein
MADQWTVASADNAKLTIELVVDGETIVLTPALADLDTSNGQDLLANLRDIVTEYRQQITAGRTPPLVVDTVVGHNEVF